MKRRIYQIIIAFFALSTIIFPSKAQSGLNDSLLLINLSYYINKPIDSLIANLPPSYDSLIVGPDETMFNGAKLVINYSNHTPRQALGFIITVWPNTHNYINRKNSQNLPFAEAWPITLLRKENVGQVEIIGPSGTIINSTDD